ncbi:MAG TPA: DUF4157 domain-containing protein [Longimicrobiales bacterium]
MGRRTRARLRGSDTAAGAHHDADPGQRLRSVIGNQAMQRLLSEEAAPQLPVRELFPTAEGRPLPAAVRMDVERRLGHDFSAVRVHSGERSEQVAAALNARAFTVGGDIAFNRGELSYASPAGRQLLMHELVHTIQQGAAHRFEPPGVSLPPAFTTVLSPRVQRQPGGSRRIRINVRRLRAMLRQMAPAELVDLIDDNPMNGSFVRARQVVSGNNTLNFELSVDFNPSPLAAFRGQKGRTVPGGPPVVRHAGAGTTTTHRIRIEVFTNRISGPELVRQIPDPVDRLHSALAETLYHELIHAQLRIDRALPAGVARSRTSQELAGFTDIARSPSFMLLRQRVREQVLHLFVMARSAVGVTTGPPAADLDWFLNATIDFLIEEKYAGQTASEAFGRRRSNADIADVYATEVAQRIERFARSQPGANRAAHPSALPSWPLEVADLREVVTLLFDEIDRERAHPFEELMPGFSPSPFAPPGPAVLGP